MPKRKFAPVPMPTLDHARRCLAVIYDAPTLAHRVSLYAEFVGTEYVPRSWLQAALFTAAGGRVRKKWGNAPQNNSP